MNFFYRYVFVAFAVVTFIAFNSCAGGKHLRAMSLKNAEQIKGTYTVILYGANHIEDLLTVAILDVEGDDYNLIPSEPAFEYDVLNGLPAEKATAEAQHFVSHHHNYIGSKIKKILDLRGRIIGFEIRPLYVPVTYGLSDVLAVDYWLQEGGRVKVNIKFMDTVDEQHHLRGVD
jgi:hypothetical protein